MACACESEVLIHSRQGLMLQLSLQPFRSTRHPLQLSRIVPFTKSCLNCYEKWIIFGTGSKMDGFIYIRKVLVEIEISGETRGGMQLFGMV